jgi:hypothetical protein
MHLIGRLHCHTPRQRRHADGNAEWQARAERVPLSQSCGGGRGVRGDGSGDHLRYMHTWRGIYPRIRRTQRHRLRPSYKG